MKRMGEWQTWGDEICLKRLAGNQGRSARGRTSGPHLGCGPVSLHTECRILRLRFGLLKVSSVSLRFLPDVVRRPLQVYSYNRERQELFDAGLYLPQKKDRKKSGKS